MNIWDVMNKGLGKSGTITVTFRKTVSIKPYESEIIEATTTLNIDREISGSLRMMVLAAAHAQLEYEVYVNLLAKGLVPVSELQVREKNLNDALNHIKDIGEEYGEDVLSELDSLNIIKQESKYEQNV